MEDLQVRFHVLTNAAQIFRQSEPKLFVVGTGVNPSKASPFQIDVLAVDQQGRSVVVMVGETMEDASGRELLGRAIMAASMVAHWEHEDLFNLLSEDSAEDLGAFLECEVHEVNREQRILFIAGRYDDETLAAARWLREHHGLGIECLQAMIKPDASPKALILLRTET